MKEKLEEFTVSQFINLVCGNNVELTEGDDSINEEAVAKAVRNIMFEYHEIADAPGLRSYLMRMEELLKARITIQIMSICKELIAHGRHEMVRDILDEMDVNACRMNEARLEAEVKSRTGRAKSVIDDIEVEILSGTGNEADLRRQFDGQTAALMAHFRLQIDMDKMKATVYAHLVARYTREVKAMAKASKRI